MPTISGARRTLTPTNSGARRTLTPTISGDDQPPSGFVLTNEVAASTEPVERVAADSRGQSPKSRISRFPGFRRAIEATETRSIRKRSFGRHARARTPPESVVKAKEEPQPRRRYAHVNHLPKRASQLSNLITGESISVHDLRRKCVVNLRPHLLSGLVPTKEAQPGRKWPFMFGDIVDIVMEKTKLAKQVVPEQVTQGLEENDPAALRRLWTWITGEPDEDEENKIIRRWHDAYRKVRLMQCAVAIFWDARRRRHERFAILKEMMGSKRSTMAWRAKQKNLTEAHHGTVSATQPHGGHTKLALNAHRIYICDVKSAHEVPIPNSLVSKTSVRDIQSQIQHDVAIFLSNVCPEKPNDVFCMHCPLVEERRVLNVVASFASPAAAQAALRSLQKAGHITGNSENRRSKWSWRYCGLAWDPAVIRSSPTQAVSPPSFQDHAQLFNLTEVGEEMFWAKKRDAAETKPKSKFTFSSTPTGFISSQGRRYWT